MKKFAPLISESDVLATNSLNYWRRGGCRLKSTSPSPPTVAMVKLRVSPYKKFVVLLHQHKRIFVFWICTIYNVTVWKDTCIKIFRNNYLFHIINDKSMARSCKHSSLNIFFSKSNRIEKLETENNEVNWFTPSRKTTSKIFCLASFDDPGVDSMK